MGLAEGPAGHGLWAQWRKEPTFSLCSNAVHVWGLFAQDCHWLQRLLSPLLDQRAVAVLKSPEKQGKCSNVCDKVYLWEQDRHWEMVTNPEKRFKIFSELVKRTKPATPLIFCVVCNYHLWLPNIVGRPWDEEMTQTCSIPGIIQGQIGLGFEQPNLGQGASAHGKRLELLHL